MAFYTDVFIHQGKIHYRGIRNDKTHVQLMHNYKPYIFLENEDGEYKTIKDIPVKKKQFNSIYEAKEFIQKYERSNVTIYGLTQFQYTFLNDIFPKEIEYDVSLINVGYIDIETLNSLDISAPEPITAITLRCNGLSHVFGCGKYVTDASDICYHECTDEVELLRTFLMIWRSLNIDIISGYNIRLFDIPYIFNRIKRLLGEKAALRLSPWKLVFEKEIMSQGKPCIVYDIKGICILDYFELYKKFTFKNHESYRLDYIGQEELGEGKVDYTEYSGLMDLYYNNFQKYIDYNIRDVVLVEHLEEKLGFISLVLALAYDAKCNYLDVLGTIRPWDIIIHNYLLERKIVVPPIKEHKLPTTIDENDNEVQLAIPGGYVKESKEGLHEWVVSLDLTSLYPHLMMMFNIGPDTRIGISNAHYEIEGNDIVLKNPPEDQNCCITANGCMYKKDKQGFMASLMESKFKNRKLFKKKMLAAKKVANTRDAIIFHNKQYAMKIQLNSLYGSLLNLYNRWFDYNDGTSITLTGQLVAKFINKVLNNLLNEYFKTNDIDYIIAQDTDSAYICLEKLAEQHKGKSKKEIVKIIVEFCEKQIIPYLNECFERFSKVTNAREQKLDMKLEKVSNRALFTTKKRYVLNALFDEGIYYDEPKLEIKGLEAVRTSTPQICREYLKKSLSVIMNENEESLHKLVKDFKNIFLKSPFEDISFPRGVNGMDKYKDEEEIYIKGTPIHVKGSLLYNHLLKKYNIKDYQPIQNGDKIKFSYLKNPNPLHENVIASSGILPEEFKLKKFIDYNMQFKKTFLEPLQNITKIIRWNTEPTVSLSEFYKN
jgi:DNA polymerase elongation subunit (family B)